MWTVNIALLIATIISSANVDGGTTSHRNLHLINKRGCGAKTNRISLQDVFPGEFPWVALLTYKGGEKLVDGCVGTLITDKYILTAAHCINNKLDHIRLEDLECESDAPEGEETFCTRNFTVKRTIVHPLYSQKTHQNDIALIELNNPAISTGAVTSTWIYGAVCLPVGEEASTLEKRLQLVTWNLRDSNSTRMLQTFLPIIDNAQCNTAYQNVSNSISISAKQFCASAAPNCIAHGGSPLQQYRETDSYYTYMHYTQYGIVSFGPARCGANNIPDVYTDVRQYITWILDSITA